MKKLSVAVVGTLLAVGTVIGVAGIAGAAKKPPATTVTSVAPNHGPTGGGTFVLIKGRNLAGASQVYFGTTPATGFNFKGANSLVASAPAEEAGMVDITVVATDGTSAIVPADEYTYVVGPAIQDLSPRVGADTGGTKVTIAGSDFTGVTAVEFGSTSVPFTFLSDNEIQTVSPDVVTPQKVDVTVTTPAGTSPIDPADVFTFAVRVPIVNAIDPPNGPVGQQVTIAGKLFAKKGTTVTFGGVPATSFTVTSSTTITATAPPGTGTVDVIVSDSKGTSSTSAGDEFTYTG